MEGDRENRDPAVSPPEHLERVMWLPHSTAAAMPSKHGRRYKCCLSQAFFPIP